MVLDLRLSKDWVVETTTFLFLEHFALDNRIIDSALTRGVVFLLGCDDIFSFAGCDFLLFLLLLHVKLA